VARSTAKHGTSELTVSGIRSHRGDVRARQVFCASGPRGGLAESPVGTADERLTALYRRYGPFIYARCARLLADRAAAEDATQETFMRVHRHLHKAPDSGEALAWIYRIATNYCLNEIRNRRLRPQADSELAAVGEDLETALANRDVAARIVRRSPEKLRAPAWLHHVDGLDQGEVARVLGISRRTVGNRLAEFVDNARKFLARSQP
jgi:RNA polymerase sigma-70 factor (ECF subfamily)